jgi:hypothetical protein
VNSSWNADPIPNRASAPASASCVWCAERAIDIGALSYGSVRSILDHKLDRHAAHKRPADGAPILHHNIRGARYYN